MRTLLPLLVLGACADATDLPASDQDPYDFAPGPYDVEIRWTSWGIPHVIADDRASAAYGMGYAFARDHACVLADQIVKVRSERALYFGRGEEDAHVNSDFGWLHLGVVRQAEEGFLLLSGEMQDALVGYSAGYNRYLEDHADALPDACRGEPWVKPISHIDLLAYNLHVAQLGSGAVLVDVVATAFPPSSRRSANVPDLSVFDDVKNPPLGSNGWAIGRDRSSSGGGMLLSNTHFPSEGERQWHESHVTVRGGENVYGASLMGVPLINIGFNEDIAWTHTVSGTPRFIAYELKLHPEVSTRYEYDGEWRDMTPQSYSIEVKQADGSLSTETRRLYRSHYGPIFAAPLVGWSPLVAFTYRDINENDLEASATWIGMNRATDLDSFIDAHRDHQGIPWVHTLFTDKAGNAFYTDSAATPNLAPEAEAAYEAWKDESIWSELFADAGVILVDGSNPVFDWVEDERAARPGAIPFDDCPQLLRSDFVANANQNHWAANPAEPLEGFPWIYSAERSPLSPRTRMNLTMLMETDGASGTDGLFDLDEMEAVALSGRGKLAEILVDQVLERCSGVGEVTFELDREELTADIGPTCAALAGWDRTTRVDARGAAAWREFVAAFDWSLLGDQGPLFADAFDPEDPVETPRVLAEAGEDDTILKALAIATHRLSLAGIAPDARLGDIQYRQKGETRVPVPGGQYAEGVIEVATHTGGGNTTLLPRPVPEGVVSESTDLTEEGYLVNNGNSWVMVLQFTDEGPQARAVLTYSQSEDPASSHFVDQSMLFAEERMRPILFREADILADPNLEVLRLTLE